MKNASRISFLLTAVRYHDGVHRFNTGEIFFEHHNCQRQSIRLKSTPYEVKHALCSLLGKVVFPSLFLSERKRVLEPSPTTKHDEIFPSFPKMFECVGMPTHKRFALRMAEKRWDKLLLHFFRWTNHCVIRVRCMVTSDNHSRYS